VATEKEVLRYELDVTDVEIKAQRLAALVAEFKAKRAAGGDMSELEAAMQREMGGVERVAGKQKEAASATAALTHHKRELASVVGILGGRFGGLVGQLGSLISLLFSGSVAAVALGAALAAITVVENLWKRFTAEIERARVALEKFKLSYDKVALGQAGSAETIQKGLSELTVYSPERFQAAFAYYGELMKLGVEQEKAATVAAPGLVAGVTPARAAAAVVTGVDIKTAEDMQRITKELEAHPAALKEMEGRVAQLPRTAVGARAVLEGELIQRELGRPGSTMFEQAEGSSPAAVLLAKAKSLELLKPQADLDQLANLLGEAECIEVLIQAGTATFAEKARFPQLSRLLEYQSAIVTAGVGEREPPEFGAGEQPAEDFVGPPAPSDFADWRRAPAPSLSPKTKALIDRLREPAKKPEARPGQWPPESSAAAEAAAGDFVGPPAELAGGAAPTTAPATVIHYHNEEIHNIGTQFAGPDRRHSGRGLRPKIGSGELDERVPC